jgi:hypothetical protein
VQTSNPAINDSKVDFPDPDLPTMAYTFPASKAALTPFSTVFFVPSYL